MDNLVIENFRPYDGRYAMDLSQGFTTREWGWLKRLSGYHPLTVEDGYRNYDPEFWCTFAVILLRRAGKIETRDVETLFERLIDQEFVSVIKVEFAPAEEGGDDDDADPTGSSTESTGSSGDGSSEPSVIPRTMPLRTPSTDRPLPSGTPASVTSASDPTTSES